MDPGSGAGVTRFGSGAGVTRFGSRVGRRGSTRGDAHLSRHPRLDRGSIFNHMDPGSGAGVTRFGSGAGVTRFGSRVGRRGSARGSGDEVRLGEMHIFPVIPDLIGDPSLIIWTPARGPG